MRQLPASFQQIVSKVAGVPVPRTRRVVSLFSGCGGLDLGFLGGFTFGSRLYDVLPFHIVWANDHSRAACQTYQANLRHAIICGDVWAALDSLPRTADVVIGGFPCQDVSVNGKGVAEQGHRTVLYRAMIQAIERTRPRAFIAENVKGLLSHKAFFGQIMAEFSALRGYCVTHQLYRAEAYGVPQYRERLFIVGLRGSDIFVPPESTMDVMTAHDAIKDLEHQSETPAFAHVWSKAGVSPEQGNRRLEANRPATTIRAEHHGNVQWHYRLNRRISVREAARLQSFPDSFQFPSGMREAERQIGNAVPPVLGWHIANAVREYLDQRALRASP